MGDEYQGRVGAQRLGLRLRTLNELRRRHAHRWNTTRLKVRHVMRTARYAGPSVAQPFDDEVDFGGDLLPQGQWRHPRVGRLGIVLERIPRSPSRSPSCFRNTSPRALAMSRM